VDWFHLAQQNDKCLVNVNTVMKFLGPKKARNLLSSRATTSFEGFCFMELIT
jgi:hypothetical protein